MPIAKVDLRAGEHDGATLPIKGGDSLDDIGDLPELPAGVHHQRAAHGGGDAPEPFDAGPPATDGLGDELGKIDARADLHEVLARVPIDSVHAFERDDQFAHAVVVDQQVRAVAQDPKGGVEFEALTQLIDVGGPCEPVGAAPDLEPGGNRGVFVDLEHRGGRHGGVRLPQGVVGTPDG